MCDYSIENMFGQKIDPEWMGKIQDKIKEFEKVFIYIHQNSRKQKNELYDDVIDIGDMDILTHPDELYEDVLNLENMSKENIYLYCENDDYNSDSIMTNLWDHFQQGKKQNHSDYTCVNESTIKMVTSPKPESWLITKGKYSGMVCEVIKNTEKKIKIKFVDNTSAYIDINSLEIIKTSTPVCIDISELSQKLLNLIRSPEKITTMNYNDLDNFVNYILYLQDFFPYVCDLVGHYSHYEYNYYETQPIMWEYFISMSHIIRTLYPAAA